ncbi:MAG TPA: flagellar biosynthesis protein FlhA [Clostridia bacterium]|nr:flagellar biosynthesis protein FlhA [Clostridia bacterium]
MLKIGDIIVSLAIIAIIVLIIIPLGTIALDFLLLLNLVLSIVVLLTSLYITEPLQFSIFPSLLLIITLFRLGLNISATRLILSNSGQAGEVIYTFGNFVISGNVVVGFIVFLILVAIQFIVITKGSERVAEVAARFTLDAMPGKQMAIDADLNSGLIDEETAKKRRKDVQREADFFGAMDGASKFVKGDAIVGILITIINFIGGIIIGMLQGGMSFGQVVEVYALATVGGGLVIQLPALLVSTATGITVTRSASEDSMGVDMKEQLFGNANILLISGGILLFMVLIPGFPKIPLLVLGFLFIFLSVTINKNKKKEIEMIETEREKQIAKEKRKPEDVHSLLEIDPIEFEFGYNIIPLVDASQGGDLLDRVTMIRKQCATELGMIIPVIRLRDNMQLDPDTYIIKIKGNQVAEGEIMPDHYLGIKSDDTPDSIDGVDTIERAFGLPAKWIHKSNKTKAEMYGYTLIDLSSVIATHLTEVLKRHGHELLTRQQVRNLLDIVKKTQPVLVEEVVPNVVTLGEVQKVLANLLREGVPIRDLPTILETLGDYGIITKDIEMLVEYVRQSLKRTITHRFLRKDEVVVSITLDPELEQLILNNIHKTKHGSYVNLEPQVLQKILLNLRDAIESLGRTGIEPIVITSPIVRYHFKRMTEQLVPDLVVLSYSEIEPDVQIHAEKIIGI